MNDPQEKSLGQVAYESFSSVIKWCQLSDQVKDDWNRAATAVQTDPRCASGLPKAPITAEYKALNTLGQTGYEAYAAHQNWYNFQGNPIPKWDEVREDIKKAWDAAAWEISNHCANPQVVHFPSGAETEKYPTFEDDLKSLINRYSIENESGTPDFILAEFLRGQLDVFSSIMLKRDEWHGNSSKDMIISKPRLEPKDFPNEGCSLDPSQW